MPINAVQTPSSVRPQDLFIRLLTKQTKLSIRLSEDLQGLSQHLLRKIRDVMARKVPLDFSFNNSTHQTIFQLFCGTTGAVAGTQGATYKYLAKCAIDTEEKAGLHKKANLFGTVIPSFIQLASQAGSSLFSGQEQTLSFYQKELDIFFEQNKLCQKNTTDAQETIASAARQMINHS